MAAKRWRLQLIPPFRFVTQPSMKQAYSEVDRLRQAYADGTSRIHHVNVQVREGKGDWAMHERILFPYVDRGEDVGLMAGDHDCEDHRLGDRCDVCGRRI